MKRTIALFLCCFLLLTFLASCHRGNTTGSGTDPNTSSSPTPSNESPTPPVTNPSDGTVDDLLSDLTSMDFTYSNRDINGTYGSGATKISLLEDKARVSGLGVVINGTSITINAKGTYVIYGTLENGSITVAASKLDKVHLVFDGANISNANGPALFIQSADKVFLTLPEGKTSTLSDGSNYAITDQNTVLDAALFSREDLAINGAGTLNINGNFKHGIVSKDDLIITGGVLNVNAKNVGLSGKDCVKINGGKLTVVAGTDGIRSDNITEVNRGFVYISGGEIHLTTGSDAIQAETVIRMVAGTVTATAGGGCDALEQLGNGLKATKDILIEGGTLTVNAANDAINSNTLVYVTNGTLVLRAGDDGIHADVGIGIHGGTVTVEKSGESLKSAEIVITGGTTNLTPPFTSAAQ